MLQHLNVFSVGIQNWTHDSRCALTSAKFRGDSRCPGPAGHTVADTGLQDVTGLLGHLDIAGSCSGLSTSSPGPFLSGIFPAILRQAWSVARGFFPSVFSFFMAFQQNFLFSQAGLLSHWLFFCHIGMICSSAFRVFFLKNVQPSESVSPSGLPPKGLYQLVS